MTDYPAFRVLRWLSTVTPDEAQHPPAEVCSWDDWEEIYDDLRHEDLLVDTRSNDGFGFVPSEEGRVAARRAAREYRPELARRCVLACLDDAGHYLQREGIEESRWANDYTGQLTAREVDEAADDLEHLGLIEGSRKGDGLFYIFKITSAGRRALRGPAPIGGVGRPTSTHQHTTTTTTVTGDHNQVAAGTHGTVNQNATTTTNAAAGYDDIDRIVRGLLDQLPVLALDDPSQATLRDEAHVVLEEIVNQDPDRTVISRALNGLRGLLSPIALGISQAATAESADIARHTIEQITGSGFA